MSRPSIRPKARESIFAAGPSQSQVVCPPNLIDCVLAMEDCCEEAQAAEELLRAGTSDLPRICRVLASDKVFLLVNESTIGRYKADLAGEIEPQINELLERADRGLRALEKQQSQLQTKVEAAKSRPVRFPSGPSTAASKLEARRLLMLKRQRERLEEEVTALEREADELERRVLSV